MSLLFFNLVVFVIASMFYVWRKLDEIQTSQRRRLRERVVRMLWFAARHAH